MTSKGTLMFFSILSNSRPQSILSNAGPLHAYGGRPHDDCPQIPPLQLDKLLEGKKLTSTTSFLCLEPYSHPKLYQGTVGP
jgi:hypothetical protein